MKIAFKNSKILMINGRTLTYVPRQRLKLIYLSDMYKVTSGLDTPSINTTGLSAWNFNGMKTGTGTVRISGAMPSSYAGKKYAIFGGPGVTGVLPVTNQNKFTICAWMSSSTYGAGEFWGVRYHNAFSYLWFYLNDATNYLDFDFGLTTSNYTLYEGTNLDDAGCRCPTSIAKRKVWAYVCLYIDRDENRAEYWVNGHHMFDISGKADLFGGAQNFDTILRFYPDSNYSSFYLCELAIWNDKKVDIPTMPLI